MQTLGLNLTKKPTFSPKVCIFLCDFIRRYQGYGNKSKMSIYQLVDPFSLFYYKFIKNNGKTDKAFWQYQIGTRQHDTWAGIRQAIHPVLVTTYGLANNQYSSAFQNVVTLKDLFK